MLDSNFVWFIDGYMKLKLYGIKIYDGIDVYFHYIIWIYVEISVCTQVSVLKQFLNVVNEIELQS